MALGIKNYKEIDEVSKSLHSKGKKLVLVGGCFDVIHIGHIDFLENAKSLGDILIVLLESDATLTRLKGMHRPIHTQKDRARILTALQSVDLVITLPEIINDKVYDNVILGLKPAIIATTIGDNSISHKRRQANIISARLVELPKTANYSTSKVARLLEKEI